ncbi:hypothetical protein [Calothrix rhizosoleniae]|uniref:hypothetical protein n=1 Tax=Calothrix rhizosoleniae TaxID=888997 RepID=UPI0013564917|nr:hypothetical protein [Calothrix rhizosoleniae]
MSNLVTTSNYKPDVYFCLLGGMGDQKGYLLSDFGLWIGTSKQAKLIIKNN